MWIVNPIIPDWFGECWGIRDASIRDDILKCLNEQGIPWEFAKTPIYDEDIVSITENNYCFSVIIKQCKDVIRLAKARYFEE